jgi:hypothetical protein
LHDALDMVFKVFDMLLPLFFGGIN